MDFPLGESSGSALSIPPIDFEGELNEEQYQAVSADPGPALVLAGAGSGKTRTLTYRVAYLLSKGVRPDEILLLTFTNKAAREMLNRVHDLSGIPGHRFWGGTFHHIGHRILRMYGEKVGLKRQFTILDQGDAESIMSEVVKEKDPAFFKNKQNPKAKVLGSVWSMVRNPRKGIDETVEAHFNHLWD
ncbi:MAG: UvrD-helicase domain-containing protein, partial [Opitutales bacterium]|nr:UvrD-helicase domain-containing protein [Opitutales bacterium]